MLVVYEVAVRFGLVRLVQFAKYTWFGSVRLIHISVDHYSVELIICLAYLLARRRGDRQGHLDNLRAAEWQDKLTLCVVTFSFVYKYVYMHNKKINLLNYEFQTWQHYHSPKSITASLIVVNFIRNVGKSIDKIDCISANGCNVRRSMHSGLKVVPV
jgi:hypothetical protein